MQQGEEDVVLHDLTIGFVINLRIQEERQKEILHGK